MNADERWFQGHLQELDEAECWELVRSREVGRVAYVDELGPMVVPLTYTSGEESVLFRVAPYSQLARHLPDSRAALEVDDFDYFTRSGWSVVLRGERRDGRERRASVALRIAPHRGRRASGACTSG